MRSGSTQCFDCAHHSHDHGGASSARSDHGYPTRTIRVLVGFTAGGGTDVMARLVGQKLQELIGQTVVVENRAGAAGRICADYAAKQPPDGYTLMVASVGPMPLASAIYPKLTYHPTRSFVTLAMIGNYPLVLVVSNTNPAKSVQEFVASTHSARAPTPGGRKAPRHEIAAGGSAGAVLRTLWGFSHRATTCARHPARTGGQLKRYGPNLANGKIHVLPHSRFQ